MEALRERLEHVAMADVAGLIEADLHYGDSWKRRGGVGAFMMLARKWDRIENRLRQSACNHEYQGQWDIFEHIKADHRPEGILDDIRDLRRYLMLVEVEMTKVVGPRAEPFGYEPDSEG